MRLHVDSMYSPNSLENLRTQGPGTQCEKFSRHSGSPAITGYNYYFDNLQIGNSWLNQACCSLSMAVLKESSYK